MPGKIMLMLTVFLLIFMDTELAAGKRKKRKKRKPKLERILDRYDYYSSDLQDDYWSGAILGNGIIGTEIRGGGTENLRWKLGRSDVYSTGKGVKSRVPIGDFVVAMKSMIQENNIHLSLYRGEAEGEVITASGSMQWKSFIPAKKMVCYIEYTLDGTEQPDFYVQAEIPVAPSDVKYAVNKLNRDFSAGIKRDNFCLNLSIPEDLKLYNEIKNAGIRKSVFEIPDAILRSVGNIRCFIQPFSGGGGYVTAWGKREIGDRRYLLAYTVDYFRSGKVNEYKAAGIVQQALNVDIESERRSHYSRWKKFYKSSFIDVPSEKVSKFYWCSIYKLGSCLRSDGKGRLLDNYGPWFNAETVSKIQCGGAVQSYYRGLNAVNHSELLQPYVALFAGSPGVFRNAVPSEYRDDGAAGLGPVTDIWGNSVSDREFGNYIYALHNVYLWCRYKQNEQVLLKKFYPALKSAVRYLLNRLECDIDGIYHISQDVSPGYGRNFYTDTSYNLSLLEWGLGVLIYLNRDYGLNDPDEEKWIRIKSNLKTLPENEDGIMTASNIPFERPDENPAHLAAFYPLKILNADSASERKLCEKSFNKWLLFKGLWGKSQALAFFQASSMASELHEGNKAFDLFERGRRSCMDLPGNPGVYFAGLESISKMLIESSTSSYDEYRIVIFPSIPDFWKNAEFRNLRAEGGFDVSAAVKNGELEYVKVKSLYGAPCNIEMNFSSDFEVDGTRLYSIRRRKDELNRTYYSVDLKRNEYIIFRKSE